MHWKDVAPLSHRLGAPGLPACGLRVSHTLAGRLAGTKLVPALADRARMRLRDTSTTGHARAELPRLRQRLVGFMRSWRRIYLGATSDPNQRHWRHEGAWSWEKMELLYETRSHRSAVLVERDLTGYARRRNLRCRVANRAAGGGGLPRDAGYYAIYILVDGRR